MSAFDYRAWGQCEVIFLRQDLPQEFLHLRSVYANLLLQIAYDARGEEARRSGGQPSAVTWDCSLPRFLPGNPPQLRDTNLLLHHQKLRMSSKLHPLVPSNWNNPQLSLDSFPQPVPLSRSRKISPPITLALTLLIPLRVPCRPRVDLEILPLHLRQPCVPCFPFLSHTFPRSRYSPANSKLKCFLPRRVFVSLRL